MIDNNYVFFGIFRRYGLDHPLFTQNTFADFSIRFQQHISSICRKFITWLISDFKGQIVQHRKYGTQLSAIVAEPVIDKDKDAIVSYLSSSIFQGIGRKTAELIVDSLGVEALDKIYDDKTTLYDIKGIPTSRKDIIYNTIIANKQTQDIILKLNEYNLSNNLILKIYNFYKHNTLRTITENPYSLIKDIKVAIIDFCNREYEENHSYDEFNILYPDLKHIGIAYTETPDKRHGIQFELDLEDYTATQYVNDVVVSHYDYVKENGSVEKALDVIKFEMENGEFNTFVSVDEEELKQAMGLEIDDEGNFYDPLSKDLDNDGIADRYDNDFKDSDYFESTYDVEDNLHTKEEATQKTGDKPSILGQIRAYQEESKTEEKQTTKEQEYVQ